MAVAAPLLALGCGEEVPSGTTTPAPASWVQTKQGFSSRAGQLALRVGERGELQVQAGPTAAATLRIATSAIQRQGWNEQLDASVHGHEGTLELARPHSRETLVLGASATEQSWTFDQAPAGEGDLVVKVAVEGGRFVRGDRQGLVFAVDGFGVRYGRATWLDAAGQRRNLESHFEGGEIAITVPSDVIAHSSFPATLDPVISAEQDIDGATFSGSRGGVVLAAAYCGGQYLAAWYEEDGRVFASRVDESGTVLDPGSLLLAPASDDNAYGLHVACVNDVFGVVWERYTNDLQKPTAVQFVRVSSGGALLDAPPKELPVAGHYTLGESDESFIYWWGGAGKIRATRISPDGPVLDDTPIDVATSSAGDMFAVTAQQGSYVFWDNGSHHMARLEADGTVKTAAAGVYLFGGSYAYLEGVAFDGQSFLAAYTQSSGIGSATVEAHAYRFDTAGKTLTQPFTIDADPKKQYALAVSAADQGFLVGHSRGDGYTYDPSYLAPISADAQTVGTPIDLKSGGLKALVRGSTSQLAVYYGGGGQMLALDGTLSGQPFNLMSARADQEIPHVAALPDQYLIAWASNGIAPVSANRLSPSGAVLDPTAIAFPPELAFSYYPHAASDGTEYVVAYHESVGYGTAASNVRLQRVSSGGKLVGAVKVVGTSAEAGGHDVASDGQGYVVVWKTQDGALHRSRYLKGTDTFEPAVDLTSSGSEADVGANSAGELAVWNESGRLRARFAYRDATPAKTQFLTAAGSNASEPDVASDGTGYLVTWRNGPSVVAQRWAANGTALDASPLVLDASYTSYRAPAATYDGVRYLVVWLGATGQDYAIKVSEISSKGLQPAITLRSDVWPGTGGVGSTVSIASQGNERSLAAYTLSLVDPPFDGSRIRARFLDYSGSKACASGAECGSGFCVDGVCCDKACGNSNPSDCQACSVVAGAAKNGTCGPALPSTVCRPSAGVCDPEESCNGVALTCPKDTHAPTTAVCRPSTGGCDAPEFCSGAVACPADGYSPVTVACRAARGECDAVEYCPGDSSVCPADTKRMAGDVCRVAAGVCDVAETCDGSSAACPKDTLVSVGTQCRDAAGDCDVAEKCDGVSAACPTDLRLPIGTLCRQAMTVCDIAERCTGDVACPADQMKAQCGEGGAGGAGGDGATGGAGGSGEIDAAGGAQQAGETNGGANGNEAAGAGGEVVGSAGGAPSSEPQAGMAGVKAEPTGPSSHEGGVAGTPDEPVNAPAPNSSSGCSCRLPASDSSNSPWGLVLLPLLVVLRRRRGASRRTSSVRQQ